MIAELNITPCNELYTTMHRSKHYLYANTTRIVKKYTIEFSGATKFQWMK